MDPEAETAEQFLLREARPPESPRQRDGILRSEVIPGFAIPVRILFDDGENLRALRTLLAGT